MFKRICFKHISYVTDMFQMFGVSQVTTEIALYLLAVVCMTLEWMGWKLEVEILDDNDLKYIRMTILQ